MLPQRLGTHPRSVSLPFPGFSLPLTFTNTRDLRFDSSQLTQVYCRHLYTFSSCSSLNLCCRLIFAHTLPALSPQDSAIAHTTGVLSTSLHLLFVFFAQSWLSLPYLTYRCIVDTFTPSLRVLRSILAVAAIPYLQVYCRHLYTFSSCSSLNLCCRKTQTTSRCSSCRSYVE